MQNGTSIRVQKAIRIINNSENYSLNMITKKTKMDSRTFKKYMNKYVDCKKKRIKRRQKKRHCYTLKKRYSDLIRVVNHINITTCDLTFIKLFLKDKNDGIDINGI